MKARILPPRGIPWNRETPRRSAQALGLKWYWTGESCKKGHIADRLVSNGCCRICLSEKQKKIFLKNPGPYLARWTVAGKNWAARNPGYFKEWKTNNHDKVQSHNRNRRARKRNSTGSHTAEDIADIIRLQKGKCACCREKLGKKYHVDHIVPLLRGGNNDRKNLQVRCADCNLSKGSKDPADFMRSIGMLI